MIDRVCVYVVLEAVFAGITGQRTLAAEDDGFAGEGAILIVRVGLHAGDALGASSGTGGRSGVLENVREIDETVGFKIRVECEAEEAAIAGCIDVAGDIDEWRCKERAVLEDSDATTFFPDEDTSVGGKHESDGSAETGGHFLVGESGIRKCNLC